MVINPLIEKANHVMESGCCTVQHGCMSGDEMKSHTLSPWAPVVVAAAAALEVGRVCTSSSI